MKDIHEQASRLLQRQAEIQADDPLNDLRKEAVSHVLARVLDAEGFTILITSTKDGKTDGLALAGGTIPQSETMHEILRMVEATAKGIGLNMQLRQMKVDACDCPACRAGNENPTMQ